MRQVQQLEPRGEHACSAKGRAYAERLLGEVLSFGGSEADLRKVPLEAGRIQLMQMLERCENMSYEKIPFCDVAHQSRVSLDVEPDRVAIPDVAGKVNPRDHLPPAQQQEYDSLRDLVLPPSAWNSLPRPCVWLRRHNV